MSAFVATILLPPFTGSILAQSIGTGNTIMIMSDHRSGGVRGPRLRVILQFSMVAFARATIIVETFMLASFCAMHSV